MTELNEKHLQAQIDNLRQRDKGQIRSVGSHYALQSEGTWTGASTLSIDRDGSREVMEIYSCRSDLEMRESLLKADSAERSAILLCSMDARTVSEDLLSRLVGGRIHPPRTREVVASYFQVKDKRIDPRILRDRPLVRALIEHAPAHGYQPSAAGTLTLDQAWSNLLAIVTGTPIQNESALSLLRWSLDDGSRAALKNLDDDVKESFAQWLGRNDDRLSPLMWQTMEVGHGENLVPFGFLLDLIYHPTEGQHESHVLARGQLKQLLGGRSIDRSEGRQWHSAVQTLMSRDRDSLSRDQRDLLSSSLDSLLNHFHLSERAYLSNESALGLEQRYQRAAADLVLAMTKKTNKALKEAVTQVSLVKEHRLASADPAQLTRLEMAQRLVQWLQNEGIAAEAESLSSLAQYYRNEGSLVDQAAHHLRQSDLLRPVQEAYQKILKRVQTRMTAATKNFGSKLQSWTKKEGRSNRDLLCVEDVLKEAVVPLAKEEPVLILVLDGMSVAVFQRLLEQLLNQGWMEIGSKDQHLPRPVIAALPSITAISRRALFLGELNSQKQGTEEACFRDNDLLHRGVKSASKAVLHRKGALFDKESGSLSGEVRDDLSDKRKKVVGIVVNAIDDHLDSGSQDNRVWDLDNINPLHEILSECREANRWIVFISDHGHVLDYGSKMLKSQKEGRGDRFRVPDGRLEDGELEMSGARVKNGYGEDKVILALDSDHRYGKDKRGYHGGANPQEVIIPLAFLAPAETEKLPDGWQNISLNLPDWWQLEGTAKLVETTRPTRTKAKEIDNGELDLFQTTQSAESLGSILVASEIFTAQMTQVAARRLNQAQVEALVNLLDEAGGRMSRGKLAEGLKLPPFRIDGLVRTASKVLNIDGYEALSLDLSTETVILDTTILCAQFELPS
jgi:hypothetical protein